MITRSFVRLSRRLTPNVILRPWICKNHTTNSVHRTSTPIRNARARIPQATSCFHTSASRNAQSPTADALMENLNDLYATAKDEFEMAAEETEKATIYAQDDRDAARKALTVLKEAFEKATKESDPGVAQDVTRRVGQRIRELENAVIAMEESATEH